ncbi:hypothetical protein BEH94_10465 [Candidatus Altiarchaeales archaeon WOR_SM1_SCG]|nr:hypothetical protein BEH94_10465 [Candidatus Altiarchaeales archaeon WOR_SM1_SCG]
MSDPKILIVEDQSNLAEELREMLEEKGYSGEILKTCGNTKDALEFIENNLLLGVLIDLKLPPAQDEIPDDRQGEKVLYAIIEKNPLIPKVIMSNEVNNPEYISNLCLRGYCRFFDKSDTGAIVDEIIRVIRVERIGILDKILDKKRESVNEFKEMIENDSLHETKYSDFLAQHYWMTGSPEYVGSEKCEWMLGVDKRVDIILKDYNGFCDVWELKLPKHNIFERYGKRWRITKHCSAAIGQAMEYLDTCYKDYYRNRSRTHAPTLYLPRGFVVIGRDVAFPEGEPDEDVFTFKDRLRLENENLKWVKIMTYGDLITRAKQTIMFYDEVQKYRILKSD